MRYSDSQFNIIDIIGSSGLKYKPGPLAHQVIYRDWHGTMLPLPPYRRGGDDQIASPAPKVVTSTISRTVFSSWLRDMPRKFFLAKKGFLCSAAFWGCAGRICSELTFYRQRRGYSLSVKATLISSSGHIYHQGGRERGEGYLSLLGAARELTDSAGGLGLMYARPKSLKHMSVEAT